MFRSINKQLEIKFREWEPVEDRVRLSAHAIWETGRFLPALIYIANIAPMTFDFSGEPGKQRQLPNPDPLTFVSATCNRSSRWRRTPSDGS